jgi:hypothetical protein
LQDYLKAGLDQIRYNNGDEGSPAFSGIALLRNSNDHATLILSLVITETKPGTDAALESAIISWVR